MEERLKMLQKEVTELSRLIVTKKGKVVMLANDPRYSSLRTDITADVIAEGRIRIGPPHALFFTYDELNPQYADVRARFAKETLADMSDSDDDGDEEDNAPEYEMSVRLPISSESVSYSFDLPDKIEEGKIYGFFVLRGEGESGTPDQHHRDDDIRGKLIEDDWS